jgi:hypothetical protein
VRRGLTWLAGAVGLAALLRHLSRRHGATPATPLPSQPVGEDPADELRRKLADQQEGEDSGDDAPAATEAAELEARRARVHAEAQAAIDSMRDAGADDPDGGPVA